MTLHRLAAGLFAVAATVSTLPASAVQVGPDLGNHIITDQPDPGLFGYVDISTTGTLIASGDDAAGNVSFPAGSTFFFYGVERTGFRVSTNGYLSTSTTDPGDDWSNDCSVTVPSEGGGDRLYALHDDLDTDVYYQHFSVENVSVIQWVGTTLGTTNVVDFQLVFFHALDVVLLQVWDNDEGGSDSTTGIQSAGATTGAVLSCDAPGSLPPGSLVAYGTLTLNEIRHDQDGTDNDEYFEISAVPGFVLTDMSFIAIGDSGTSGGVIEAAIGLNTVEVDPTGAGYPLVTVCESTFSLNAPCEYEATLDFENGDNISYALVAGLSAGIDTDVDTDDDGNFDVAFFTDVYDSVAVINQTPGDHVYTPVQVVAVGADPTGHIQRCDSVHGAFTLGAYDAAAGLDTPTGINVCPTCGNSVAEPGEACDDGGESASCNLDCTVASCGDGVVNATAGEACDDMGETVACNLDCTAASCGDGVVNATAGETCDDMGRSLTCDLDCTAVSCGDGFVNATAGEQCDGDGAGTPGETAACDTDCTNAMCGDSIVNASASETCDEGGEAATCDDDCTAATCGDGNTNATAGEECDDSNTTAGDGCDANCLIEGGMGGMGGMGQGGMGQGGMATGGMGQGGMATGGMGQGGIAAGGMGQGGDGTGNTGNSGPDDDGGETEAESGCNCSTPGRTAPADLAPLAMLFGLGLVVRRRRRPIA